MAITFEGYDKRIKKINTVLKEYKIKDLEEANKICLDKGIDVAKIVKGIQMIAFENAVWAYTLGTA
ncbi:MAG: GGGtGRT protein, partial [Firmicutes bacterium]|nr:GGGtGRT protein [Bacillota bacterium]